MRSRSLWVPCQCIIMVITSAHVVVPLNKHKCLIQRLCIIHPTLTFKVRRKLLSLFPYQPNVAGIMPRNSVIFFFFFIPGIFSRLITFLTMNVFFFYFSNFPVPDTVSNIKLFDFYGFHGFRPGALFFNFNFIQSCTLYKT